MVRKNSRKSLVQYVLGEERMKEKRVTLGSILQMDEQMGMVIGFRIGEKAAICTSAASWFPIHSDISQTKKPLWYLFQA